MFFFCNSFFRENDTLLVRNVYSAELRAVFLSLREIKRSAGATASDGLIVADAFYFGLAGARRADFYH